MKQHGLDIGFLQKVFKATVVPKLLYASPAWPPFISASTLQKYEAFLRRAIRLGYNGDEVLTFSTLLDRADSLKYNQSRDVDRHSFCEGLSPKIPDRTTDKKQIWTAQKVNNSVKRILKFLL